MTTYARKENGYIVEVFPPVLYDVEVRDLEDPEKVLHKIGDEVPIEERFHPDFVAGLVAVPDGTQIDQLPGRQPTPEEVISSATAMRDQLLNLAALRIAPLQDAVDLGEVTEAETALLRQWKQFRVTVNRIDLNAQPITWPEVPQ